jgi:hypothetical protein
MDATFRSDLNLRRQRYAASIADLRLLMGYEMGVRLSSIGVSYFNFFKRQKVFDAALGLVNADPRVANEQLTLEVLLRIQGFVDTTASVDPQSWNTSVLDFQQNLQQPEEASQGEPISE